MRGLFTNRLLAARPPISSRVCMQFDHFDIDGFLSDYWQKKPLLIKNPWKSWRNQLEPDELAGLACEDEVESRLIKQERESRQVQHGPLPETLFSRPSTKPGIIHTAKT